MRRGYPAGSKPLSEFKPLRQPAPDWTLREELAVQASSWIDHHDEEKCHEHRCYYCALVGCGRTLRIILDRNRAIARTLGTLGADDLGRPVRFRVGGATYEGALTKAQHTVGLGGEEATFLVLEGPDNWVHMETYRSVTPCEVGQR